MKRTKIILDVDTGHDDAVAIMLAGKSPYIDLQAITVVAGNQVLEKTVKNTLNVCSAVGINNVPIAAGMSGPILRKQIIADDIHGDSGLDGPHFSKPTLKLDNRHAVDLIIEILKASEGDITLVPVGPLTNIAMAVRKEPDIIPKINQIVLMGGAYGLGNRTPAAEFNIFADPEAAQIVFDCGRPIIMVGLDLTFQAQATEEVIRRIETIDNKASKLFVELMSYFGETYRKKHGLSSPPVHDPTTIAYLIDSTVFETKPMFVEIDTNKTSSYGRTLCDYYGVLQKKQNAQVATKLDFNKFWNIVYDTLSLY